jgi:hypothetical protein
MNLGMAIGSVKGFIETISNPDMSFLDKLTSGFMSLGILIPNLIPIFSKFNSLY